MRNECLVMTTRELERHGITYMLEQGGKHLRLIWIAGGKNNKTILPNTPSDWRSGYNARAQLRQQMREVGVVVHDDDTPAQTEGPALTIECGEVMCSSLAVAQNFEKTHKDVLEAIDRIIGQTPEEFSRRNFPPAGYIDQQGKPRRSFDMTRDGFSLLVMGFTGEKAMRWKLAYIDAFNRMENELRKISQPAVSPAMDAELKRLRADVEALTDLVLEAPRKSETVTVVKFKRPFVRPSVLRRQRVA